MYRSKDKRININVVKDVNYTAFQPADWSVVNLSCDPAASSSLFKNLFQTTANRHLVLGLCRHKRKDRLTALTNLESIPFQYLETVSITYEKPKSCSNNGFLPLSEIGFVLYKGSIPDASKTKWFREDYNNATNSWDLGVQDADEGDVTYYQRFSWELQLILASLAGPLNFRKFIYALPLNKDERQSLFKFCKKRDLSVELFVSTTEEASDMLKHYESLKG